METKTTETTIHDNAFQPKTTLGRKLWEIRQKIVASGEPLLGWEELEKEVTERRNERQSTEGNLHTLTLAYLLLLLVERVLLLSQQWKFLMIQIESLHPAFLSNWKSSRKEFTTKILRNQNELVF